MGRYRRVLVAFDGSESSRNALLQAMRLAETEKSWIKVVAVVPAYEGDIELTGVKDIEAALRGPAEKLLAEAEKLASEHGVSIIKNVEHGEAYERIVDVAAAENCDIIVMGRRGRGRLGRALMGSVTARVIGHTDRDVLVMSRNAALAWDSILLPTDGSKYSDAATERAINLAKSYGCGITAVSVVHVPHEFYAEAPDIVDELIGKAKSILEVVRRKAEAAGLKVETVVKEGEVADVITALAREKGASVVVMGSHGRSGLKRLLMGSTTEGVIGHAGSPVLVVRS